MTLQIILEYFVLWKVTMLHIISLYVAYHQFEYRDIKELTMNQFPPISISKFILLPKVGKKTQLLLERLSMISGIELLP